MSPRARSSSQRSNDLYTDATAQTQKCRRNTSNPTSNVEPSAQAAARTTTSKIESKSSIMKKTSPRNLSKKVIGVSQSEQDPVPQISVAATTTTTTTTTTNKAHQKLDNYNDQDNDRKHEQKDIDQELGENQQEQVINKRNNFCFKGEGKFYLNFPFPVFSAATSNISLLCGNKDIIDNSPNNIRNDFTHVLGNLKDMIKAVKTVAGKTENCCKRGYSTESDDYEQQKNEEEQMSKRPCRGQSEASQDDKCSLFTDVSSRVLELQDQIKIEEEQLNVLHNQYGQLEKLYHEAFGVVHCNNGIARDAAVIQFSHKASTIASSAFNLWHSSDKLSKDAKQLVDIFMNESFEGEKGGYIDSEEQCREN